MNLISCMSWRSAVWLISPLLLLWSNALEASENEVTLTLRSCQYVYVLQEPLMITGELVNGSSQQIRIYGIEKFSDPNMPCLFLEIITPSGRKQERKNFFWEDMHAKGETYMGEPLNPGERFAFDIFPNALCSIYDIVVDSGWAFPSPGEYKVRLVYEVEEFRIRLWKPPGNRLYSNQITIRVVEPYPAQKEILDAYWAEPGQGYGFVCRWDGEQGMAAYEVNRMKGVLDKYPQEPFIKYIHYALLHQAMNYSPPALSSARSHAEYLMNRFPSFRPGRVRRAYAAALIECGQKAEGLRLLEEALRLEPHLKDDHGFMSLMIRTERGENAYWPWRSHRNDTRSNEEPTPKKE
jgi:hypothetical protein